MANKRKDKRKQTQRQQAAAEPKLHPRGLARSIAKSMGLGMKNWRSVSKLPKYGQKYLHPERHSVPERNTGAIGGKA